MLHHANYSGTANAKKVWTPILDKMSTYPTMTKASINIVEYPTYKGYFDARFGAIDKMKMDMPPAPKAPWEQAGRRRRGVISPRHGPGMESGAPVPNAIVNLDSRLLGAAHFAHPNLTSILKASSPFALGGTSAVVQGHLVSGNKAHRPDDDSMFPPRFHGRERILTRIASVLPAWRKAYVHTIGYNTPGKASIDALRSISPESGAYANEVNVPQV